MRLRALLFAFSLLAPTAGRAQAGFSIVASPGASPGTGAVPNTTWADTPYENAPPTYPDDDDWSAGGGEAFPVYLAPDEGLSFGAVDAMVTWDPGVMTLTAVSTAGGLFDDPTGAFFWTSPAPGQLRINASRLDGQNVTAGAADVVARLEFELVAPGYSEIMLSDLDARRYDGVGGQTMLTVGATSGALRAYLGDVAAGDGSSGDPTTGDGLVEFEDLALLGLAYYAGTEATGFSLDRYKLKLDIGPTADGSVFSAPQPDQKIEFEDLMIFALSYTRSAQSAYPRASTASPATFHVGAPQDDRGDLLIPLQVSQVADLRGFAVELTLDPAFDLVAVETAGGLGDGRTVFLTHRESGKAMHIDAAVLDDAPLSGSGPLVTLRLRPRTETANEARPVALTAARLRTSGNAAIPVQLQPAGTVLGPSWTGLGRPHPNPMRGVATVPFVLAEAGPVSIQVLDALGRTVAVLADTVLPEGAHRVQWTPAGLRAGTYLLRLQAGPTQAVRSITVLP